MSKFPITAAHSITQELAATPPLQVDAQEVQQPTKNPKTQAAPKVKAEKIEKPGKSEHDIKMKQQRKDFNEGSQDSVRQYSEGCD